MDHPQSAAVRLTVDAAGLTAKRRKRLQESGARLEAWLTLLPDYLEAAFGTTIDIWLSSGESPSSSAHRMQDAVELRLTLVPEDLDRTTGDLSAFILLSIIGTLGKAEVFRDEPLQYSVDRSDGDDASDAIESVVSEVLNMEANEMLILGKSDSHIRADLYRIRVDKFLVDRIGDQVASLDGDGDYWFIRL